MKANESMIRNWCKKKDYKTEEVSQIIVNELLAIYKNPSIVYKILDDSKNTINEVLLEGEVWIDAPDYEGLYAVSNKGRVKSLAKTINKGSKFEYVTKEKILKPSISKDGYVYIWLAKNGKMKQYAIHRLVAIAFIPNNNLLHDVNHKDENKLNNCVENLEWCSKEYNTKYGTRTQRVSKPILQYAKDGQFIQEFKSVKEASRIMHIGSSNIANCANSKTLIKDGKEYVCRSAGGFVWRYK